LSWHFDGERLSPTASILTAVIGGLLVSFWAVRG
jgi:hypothetical protein